MQWAALVPTRWSWLRLLATPSSYVLVVALVITIAAKAHVLRTLEDLQWWPATLFASAAPDAAVFFGLAAMCAIAERVTRRALFVTIPLALAVLLLAALSALQLRITGEQLSADVLLLALERFRDVRAMAHASVDIEVQDVVVTVLALGVVPFAAGSLLHRKGHEIAMGADGTGRACAASTVTAFALLVTAFAPVREQLSGLQRNAVLHTAWGVAAGERSWNSGIGLFAGYKPRELVEPQAVEKLRTGPRPNILVVILESVRRDATTLAGAEARARTPNLVELAARGVEVTRARAVVPHTTRSMWSMFCGRLPIQQPKLYETTSAVDVQCLPHILAAAGWRTAFLQSATGRFEDRPRLVRRLGFREFLAAEQYTTTLTGYLSTDDEALVEQFERWLDRSPASPFMVTLLTSATHHPYLLTEKAAARARAAGLPMTSDRERYDRQIEASDHMLGDVLALLRRRGLAETTIVVVIGDHGEGFGEKPARQHALNFYEEGLRVPWVIAGPGVPTKRIDENASLVDLAPTLLDLLGVTLSPSASAASHARSVLRISEDRVLPFSCFFEKSCFGFVAGQTKVVSLRELGVAFAFDLASDPHESSPRPLDSQLTALLAGVQHTIDRHRMNNQPIFRDPMPDFYPWNCPLSMPCGIRQ